MGMKTADLGIGTDIEEVERFRLTAADPFLKKVFKPRELAYCFSKKDPAPHLAARFCGKEAIIKALGGLRVRGITFEDIEIVRAKNGLLSARLSASYAKKYLVRVTISHTTELALGFAVAYRIGISGEKGRSAV